MDMSQFVIPKSDQLNADDLSTPRTIRITKVTGTGNADQPVSVHFEGDDGRPYKPCKSMRRVMIAGWGVDASQYVGRSMTLYRDPKVVFGGMEVGGIRISHMSHLDRPLAMALTVTKAKRAPYKVQPLAMSKEPGVTGPAPSRTPAVDPDTAAPDDTMKGDPSDRSGNGSGGSASSPWTAGSLEKTERCRIPLVSPYLAEARYFATVEGWCDALDMLLTGRGDPFELWTENMTTHTELTKAAKTDRTKIALKRVADAAAKAINEHKVAIGGPGV